MVGERAAGVIKITDNHAARLARLNPANILPAMGQEIEAAAQSIVDIARFNINDGAISGPGHIAGAPYGYPNSDTHELEQSLHVGETLETPGEIKTSAIADAPYSAWVELGTSRALPRPYMVSSTEEVRPTVLPALAARFIEEVNT